MRIKCSKKLQKSADYHSKNSTKEVYRDENIKKKKKIKNLKATKTINKYVISRQD